MPPTLSSLLSPPPPLHIPAPSPPHHIPLEPLTQATFAPFGTATTAPPSLTFPPADDLPPNAVPANQGSAVKVPDVLPIRATYKPVASGVPAARPTMSMFLCGPRELRDAETGQMGRTRMGYRTWVERRGRSGSGGAGRTRRWMFDVGLLERHPFTSQTFMPIGLEAKGEESCFLIVVAPTMAGREGEDAGEDAGGAEQGWTTKFGDVWQAAAADPRRSGQAGPPDLRKARAFLAHGGQSVTYAAGTWHAPMVVLGTSRVDFMVFQFVNGVAEDDCQEAMIEDAAGEGGGLAVVVDIPVSSELGMGRDPTGREVKL